ncbi:MAG: peroxiredoxin family protein [Acidimicrobiia bacterium]|nr:peroxiredoxin family protein [Acidimicrobiia bacterium]
MASLSQRHPEILAAGFRVAAIDIDDPDRHAAMVAKLQLAFPMLSDPDRTGAIAPYGLEDSHDPRRLAIPALVAAEPGGAEFYRFVARDYADRLPEDDLLEVLETRGLPPTTQPPPTPGHASPGPGAMPLRAMIPYFRGGRFAALALGLRHRHLGEDFKDDSKAFVAEMDRFVEAVKSLKSRQ